MIGQATYFVEIETFSFQQCHFLCFQGNILSSKVFIVCTNWQIANHNPQTSVQRYITVFLNKKCDYIYSRPSQYRRPFQVLNLGLEMSGGIGREYNLKNPIYRVFLRLQSLPILPFQNIAGSEYRRLFVSPKIGGIGRDDCNKKRDSI